jgi:hypothetical protein
VVYRYNLLDKGSQTRMELANTKFRVYKGLWQDM